MLMGEIHLKERVAAFRAFRKERGISQGAQTEVLMVDGLGGGVPHPVDQFTERRCCRQVRTG